MPYVPGGDCNIGSVGTCDRCFPSKSTSPVVVKILRPINRNAGRFSSNRGDCCNCRMNKRYANQMVYNQNKIVNFDLINRLNEANGISPIVTYTSTPPGGPLGKRNCDNCLRILRDKELQLLKKEQEILKIKTHFTNLPKRAGAQDGLGTNCEHCFRALREKEFELFRKEQEIAKMRRAALGKNPIDTLAKVDRARCTNCFKELQKKELELIKKEHALLKNMTRPNINVKNLNYCSCCRDNKKSPLKKQEELRKINRDNCFKQLRMKEIRLLAKEKEIDKKIQQFREESIAKAKMDLQKTPDPRLIKPTTQEVIKCVCSCTGLPPQVKEKKGVCALFYKKSPAFRGGLPGQPPLVMQQIKSKDIKLSSKALKDRKCTGPCCVMKLAANMAQCFLAPPNAKKPSGLSEVCKFVGMVPWCSSSKNVVKCCIEPIKPQKELSFKEQKQIEKRIKTQKSMAIKAAKAVAKSAPGYKVDTIGQIRPGMSKPPSMDKLNVLETEVLRSYGPRGLKAYMTKMAELKIDTEVAHAKIPRRDPSKTEQFKTEKPSKFSSKATKQFMSKMGIQRSKPKESKKIYSATRFGTENKTETPSTKFKSIKGTFKTKLYDRVTKAAKPLKKTKPDYIKTKTDKAGNYDQVREIAKGTVISKSDGSIKSKIKSDKIKVSKKEVTRKSNRIFGYSKGKVTKKPKDDESIEVAKKYKTKINDDRIEATSKFKAKLDDDDRTEVSRKFKAKMDDDDKTVVFKKFKAKIADYRTAASRKFKPKSDDDYKTVVSKKFKAKMDDDRTEASRKFKAKMDDDDKTVVSKKFKAKMDDDDRTEVSRKFKAKMDDDDKTVVFKKFKAKIDDYRTAASRKFKPKSDDDYKTVVSKKFKAKMDDDRTEASRKFKAKIDDDDKTVVSKKFKAKVDDDSTEASRKFKAKLDDDDKTVVSKKFKAKVDDDSTEATRKFKAHMDDDDTTGVPKKFKARMKDDDRTEVSKKFKPRVDIDDITDFGPRKFRAEVDDVDRTEVSRKFKARMDDGDRSRVCVCTKSIAKIDDYDGTVVSRKFKANKDNDWGEEVSRKFKANKEKDWGEEVSRKFKANNDKDWGEETGRDKRYVRKYGYERMIEDEDNLPRNYNQYKNKRRFNYERNLPKRYRTKVDDEDYEEPVRGYGSRAYRDEWGSTEKIRRAIPWYPSTMPVPTPRLLKRFGRSLVYCAGCFIGIPCIIFLCLCFLMSTCSD